MLNEGYWRKKERERVILISRFKRIGGKRRRRRRKKGKEERGREGEGKRGKRRSGKVRCRIVDVWLRKKAFMEEKKKTKKRGIAAGN